MNKVIAKILDDACDISNLHGQISALYRMKAEICEKLIILEADLKKRKQSNDEQK